MGRHDRGGGGTANIGREALLRATALLWQAQDVYTDAMTAAYRRQAMHQALADEAERSALTEALLQARITDDRSLWEVAQLLRLPPEGSICGDRGPVPVRWQAGTSGNP